MARLNKHKTSVVTIGLIDMLTGFLVSSIILMLIIAYNSPDAGNLAGYPRSFVTIEFLVIGSANDLDLRRNGRFSFYINTADKKELFNEVSGDGMARDARGYLVLRDKNDVVAGSYKMWGPAFRMIDGSVNQDTLVYTFYAVSAADDTSGWRFTVRYYDNDLVSNVRFDAGASSHPKIDRVINTPLQVTTRWSFLKDNALVSKERELDFGEIVTFNVPDL